LHGFSVGGGPSVAHGTPAIAQSGPCRLSRIRCEREPRKLKGSPLVILLVEDGCPGRCLTRRLRFRAGVNKRGKTEPETRRRGGETEWNRGRVGGPTVVGSNREMDGDAKFFERLRRHGERCRQPTGTQINGGKRLGSVDVAKFEVPLRRALSNGGSSSHPVEVASDFAFNNAKISQSPMVIRTRNPRPCTEHYSVKTRSGGGSA
jgi:hypothetical protein